MRSLPPDDGFVDADFIPASVAVAVDALRVEELGVVQWRPAVDALPGAALFAIGTEEVDVASTEGLDDGWLVGAMMLVATRPELIVHLFALTDHIDRGLLTLRLFKHGSWIPVTIDTMLPCNAGGRCPAIA